MVSSGRVLSACNYLKNYGRFRENQGFQQTRGLIRLMRVIVSRIWQSDRDPYLIATHDIDLESRETLTQINNTLGNAIAHDIASGGGAVSETIDANLGGCEDAQDVMNLLLIASLANVPNAVKGLTIPDIVANLCAPGRDVSQLPGTVIARLATVAWYLRTTNDGRLHLRNVQNLYLAAIEIAHWQGDAAAAYIVAGAVENDHV